MVDALERQEHSVELPMEPEEALSSVAGAAEVWGAAWKRQGSGGRLTLPVTAGLRHGRLDGRVWTEPASANRGTRILFRIDDASWALHWRAVVILLFGAVGAVSFTLWPFYPPLLTFAPIALVLAFAAWFLVASRLRTAGPEEFFELVAHPMEAAEPPVDG